MRTWKLIIMALVFSGLAFAAGCDGGSSSAGDNATLSLYMTDAATEDYQAVYVTIDEVWVHRSQNGDDPGNGDEGDDSPVADPDVDDGWERVASPGRTYNLLELVNGAMVELGTTNLPSGRYTQIRLMLGEQPDNRVNLLGQTHQYPNYIIESNSTLQEPLFVPSGYQTGIKLVHAFILEAGITADLVIDFDASRSVVVAGRSGRRILKPTIKIIDTIEFPLVRGEVTSGGAALPGARVSAQVFDTEASADEDPLTVVTSTVTNQNGFYQMYLPVGTYNIVAYKGPGAAVQQDDFYGPACESLEALSAGSVYERNLSLGISGTGDIPVTVHFPENGQEELQTVSISVREASVCSQSSDLIEIASVVGSGSPQEPNIFEYTLSVPGITAEAQEEGTPYTIVAQSGGVLIEESIEVRANLNTPVVFDFSSPE